MIPSASPLALIARAAPLGDAVAGQDASALGDTGFSALFAGLMPGGDEAATVPEMPVTVVMPQLVKAAKLAATGGKMPQAATETGKKLPVLLPEADTGETDKDADLHEAATDPAMQLALAFTPPTLPPTLPMALAEPITVTPQQVVSVRQMAASQAAGSTAPVANATASAAPPLPDTAPTKHAAAAASAPSRQDAPLQPAVQLTIAAEPEIALATAPVQAEMRPIAMATASQLQFQMQALPVVEGKPARAVPAVPAMAAEPVETLAPVQDKPAGAATQPQISAATPPFSAAAAKPQNSSERRADAPSQPAAELLTAEAASPTPASASALAPVFTAAAPAAAATPAHIPAPSTATHHAQDVARIIDQLAAAREALAPATAALNIDHAEFGQLSLRIDQRADGGLAVQLAAANPEAHRAVSAAMSAQSGSTGNSQFTQGDSQTGNPSAQGNAPSANGNSADRNTRGGTAQGRQDQPSGQRRNPATTTGSEPQSGTFA